MNEIILQQCCYGSIEGKGYHFQCSDPLLVESEPIKKDIRLLFDTPNNKDMQSCFSCLTTTFGQKESYTCFFQAGWNQEEKRLMQYGQMYMAETAHMEYGEAFLQLLRVQFERGEDVIRSVRRPEKAIGELKKDDWEGDYSISPEDLQQILTALFEKKQVAYVMNHTGRDDLLKARYLIWEVYRRLPYWYRKNLGCTAGTTSTFMLKEDFPAYKLIVLWNEENEEGLKNWKEKASDRCVIRQERSCPPTEEPEEDRERWIREISCRRERLPEDFLSEEFEKCRDYIEKNLRPAEMPPIDLYIEFLKKFNSWKGEELTDEKLDEWIEDYKEAKLQKPLLSTLGQYHKFDPDMIAGWLRRKEVYPYLVDRTGKAEALPDWIRYFGLYEQLLGKDGRESCREKICEHVLEQSNLGKNQMQDIFGGLVLQDEQESELEEMESLLNIINCGRGQKSWWVQLLQQLLLAGRKNQAELQRQIADWTAKEAEKITRPLTESSLFELQDVINRCMEEMRSVPEEAGKIIANSMEEMAIQRFIKCQEDYEIRSLEELKTTIGKAEELISCFPWLADGLGEKWKSYRRLFEDRVFDSEGYMEKDVLKYLELCRNYGSAGNDMRRLFLLKDDPLWNRDDRKVVRRIVREETFGKLEKKVIQPGGYCELTERLKWLQGCLIGTGAAELIIAAVLLVQLWLI